MFITYWNKGNFWGTEPEIGVSFIKIYYEDNLVSNFNEIDCMIYLNYGISPFRTYLGIGLSYLIVYEVNPPLENEFMPRISFLIRWGMIIDILRWSVNDLRKKYGE